MFNIQYHKLKRKDLETQYNQITNPPTQETFISLQWSKWAGEKNLRKNQVFWLTFIFWSILLDTLFPCLPWSPGAQAAYLSFLWLTWAGGKNIRKTSVLINFFFLVIFTTISFFTVQDNWQGDRRWRYNPNTPTTTNNFQMFIIGSF